METADYIENRGFGNYLVIKYSKYIATIVLENGEIRLLNVKDKIKDAYNITRITKAVRRNVEDLLPINIAFCENKIRIIERNK